MIPSSPLHNRWLDGDYRLSVGPQLLPSAYQTDSVGPQVVIQESITEIGHRVWDTSVLMSKYFEKNPTLGKGKAVLELGSGTGLLVSPCETHRQVNVSLRCLSIFCSDDTQHTQRNKQGIFLGLCGCQPLVLTESKRILKALESNVAAHASLLSRASSAASTAITDTADAASHNKNTIRIEELDWTNEDQVAEHAKAQYDIIIGSDLVITGRDTSFLGNVLMRLARPGTVVYLGSPIHREGYIQLVKDLNDNASPWSPYEVETVPEAELHPDYQSRRIVILRLIRR